VRWLGNVPDDAASTQVRVARALVRNPRFPLALEAVLDTMVGMLPKLDTKEHGEDAGAALGGLLDLMHDLMHAVQRPGFVFEGGGGGSGAGGAAPQHYASFALGEAASRICDRLRKIREAVGPDPTWIVTDDNGGDLDVYEEAGALLEMIQGGLAPEPRARPGGGCVSSEVREVEGSFQRQLHEQVQQHQVLQQKMQPLEQQVQLLKEQLKQQPTQQQQPSQGQLQQLEQQMQQMQQQMHQMQQQMQQQQRQWIQQQLQQQQKQSPRECAVCHKTREDGAVLRRCRGCGALTAIRYCGLECCRRDWVYQGHRKLCEAAQELLRMGECGGAAAALGQASGSIAAGKAAAAVAAAVSAAAVAVAVDGR